MTSTDIPAIDEARLEAFVGQAVVDMGAAISGLLLHIGDRLGLYKAMAGAGPITSTTLAQRNGTTERYVREWLGREGSQLAAMSPTTRRTAPTSCPQSWRW
jgi:winged helix-turn-helix protein